jgi:hypothetical protein
MNTIHYSSQALLDLFQQRKIVTLPEMKEALGTATDMTVYRKLSGLPYRTSYSHRGAYYTLDTLAEFDRQGLWTLGDVHFSQQGTLLDTVATLVDGSSGGYSAEELHTLLGVEVKDALRHLAYAGRLHRQKLGGRFLYEAAGRARRQEQRAARQAQAPEADQLAAAMVLFYSLLDEQQRRLFAGLESLAQGRGGDRRMAELLGLDVATVARGRKELLRGQILRQRVRQTGAGRPGVEKKRPMS